LGKVFVSHSAKDKRGKAFVQSLFSDVEHEAKFYEWEGPDPPHWQTIRDRVKESVSVIVLSAKELENPVTTAWVSFEIGLALAQEPKVRPVWVLERLIGSGAVPTKVPIPGLTGYMERPETLDSPKSEPYHSLAAGAGLVVPVDEGGKPLQEIVCLNRSCRARYYVYFEGERLVCPACRTDITLKR
jgi:hypothetical protein